MTSAKESNFKFSKIIGDRIVKVSSNFGSVLSLKTDNNFEIFSSNEDWIIFISETEFVNSNADRGKILEVIEQFLNLHIVEINICNEGVFIDIGHMTILFRKSEEIDVSIYIDGNSICLL